MTPIESAFAVAAAIALLVGTVELVIRNAMNAGRMDDPEP